MKRTLLLTLFFSFVLAANAQRYIPGYSGISMRLGITESLGYFAGVDYSTYTKKKNRWVFGAEYLQNAYNTNGGKMSFNEFLGDDNAIPLCQFTGEAGYYIKFLSDGTKTFFMAIGVSLMLGYETINWSKKLLPDGTTIASSDNFLWGGAFTLEAEYYLSDQHVLLFSIRQRTLGGSSITPFHTQLGIGLKFILE